MFDIGIDVGGTFTDGVLILNNKIVKNCKVPTNKNLLASISETIDNLVDERNMEGKISRIIVSTTLMTNIILENKFEKTELFLLPGPGIGRHEYKFPFPFQVLKGAVDFQGRIIEEIDEREIITQVDKLVAKGVNNLGIIGKFSPRNPALEYQVQSIAQKIHPALNISLGHQVSGNLNFMRRAMSTGLDLATRNLFAQFILSLEGLIREKALDCPLYILKADGGIIPIAHVCKFSVDTILSGPAASALGAKALLGPESSAIVVDIGGTTSDFSLILNSQPLYASKGVKILGNYTHIRSLAVHSIPLGGDTSVKINDLKELEISFYKEGLPVCLGGDIPTITDCMRILELTTIGDKEKAVEALQEYGEKMSKSVDWIAEEVLDKVTEIISETIENTLHSWQEEPAYRIWQLVNRKLIEPEILICLGGPAAVIGNLLAKRTKYKIKYNSLSNVANAVGSALALPTFEALIRFNTQNGEISASWGFYQRQKPMKQHKHTSEEVKGEAVKIFKEYLQENNIYYEPEVIRHEIFNMVRDWNTVGQIHELLLALQPRIKSFVDSKE